MKQIALLVFLVCGFTYSFAQNAKAPKTTSWTGYLADRMCSDNLITSVDKAAGHTKECLVEDHCAGSGYGVIVDGKWYQFDKKGNELTAALLKMTNRERGIQVEVTGTIKKNKIAVTNLAEKN